MLTAVVFIVILIILIFVHELGHFVAAKKNGVKVEEFGFGFPPRIFGIKRGETIYSVNWIPLGGFVKIYGEDGGDRRETQSFGHKKIWQRATILFAGVFMNFLLAVLLLSVGFGIGLPTSVDDDYNALNARVQVTEIGVNSPAQTAGLKTGDTIVSMKADGQLLADIGKVAQVQEFTDQNRGRQVTMEVQRSGEVLTVNLVPRVTPPADQGAMGVGLARTTNISYPWYQAIYEGFVSAWNLIKVTVVAFASLLWRLLSGGQIAAGEVVGPVGIYSITGAAAQMGWIYVLQLTALLSLNLAIINILPFPALDGGRLLFLLVEKIKGSPISERVERITHTAGFVFLILLMVFITFRDIIKIL